MHRSGFVNILGKPNAGKSTLLNALVGEKLAIVTPKVQTTRHRIMGILNEKDYQVVFSDTPGIIEPRYKLHTKMMEAVKRSLEDADVVLILADIRESVADISQLFGHLKFNVPVILALNKIDLIKKEKIEDILNQYKETNIHAAIIPISALQKTNLHELLEKILSHLPEAPSYYPEDELTDRPMRFFAAEIIREKIFLLLEEEIPYHTAVVVNQFQEKTTLTKIVADIIVSRESQKAILLGEKGKMIKTIGTKAREEIEQFIHQKVFLELHVKVRAKWRDNDIFLKEYGYDQ